MDTYDWIVAGGGASGISLVNHMIDSGLKGNILLLEKAKKQSNDRTWCYWSKESLPGLTGSDSVWDLGEILTKKNEEKFSMGRISYRMIRSGGFYRQMYDRFSEHPRVEIRYEKVVSMKGYSDFAEVHTNQGVYRARYVFNSLLPHSPVAPNFQWGLKQHFVGTWIETETDTFDPERIRLMDFRVPQGGEVQFVYVLPISPRKALIEYTAFSLNTWKRDRYLAGIKNYLKTYYDLENYTVLEEESGVIPMSRQVFPRISDERVVHIGTAGGMTKASTGYTFHRIQEDSKEIVKNLMETGFPIPDLKATGRFAFYDRLLLWLIEHEPHRVPEVMRQLFSANSADQVFRFLHEKTTLVEEIVFFARLHWPPFLKALRHAVFKTQPARTMGPLAKPSHIDVPLS
ncbi:MAG: lycopene cyclase family protein [Bacteroidota bacterium]